MDVEKTLELMGTRLDQVSGLVERVARTQLELAERQTLQEKTVSLLVTAVGQLRDHAQETDQRMERGFREFREEMREGFKELREAQQQTEQNLNALIKIVDDLIRRDGRGH